VEEGTLFHVWSKAGKLALPVESDAVEMLTAASHTLRGAGFEHYELSNYAQPGHRCRHNMVYWLGHSYYAFGVGSASFLQSRRFSRPNKLVAWQQWVDGMHDATRGMQGSPHDGLVAGHDAVKLGTADRMLESLMLQLRLADGVALAKFGASFGDRNLAGLLEAVQPHVHRGLVQVVCVNASGDEDFVEGSGTQLLSSGLLDVRAISSQARGRDWKIRLHDPNGLMVSNSIISDVFVKLTS
jgi:coproporphyrinogen III oxidase-like Fe-S oxidoreductase